MDDAFLGCQKAGIASDAQREELESHFVLGPVSKH